MDFAIHRIEQLVVVPGVPYPFTPSWKGRFEEQFDLGAFLVAFGKFADVLQILEVERVDLVESLEVLSDELSRPQMGDVRPLCLNSPLFIARLQLLETCQQSNRRGKSCVQVAALTGESPVNIASAEQTKRHACPSSIIKTIRRRGGAVEIILEPGEGTQGKKLLVAPACRKKNVDNLIECLKTLPRP